MPHVCTNPTSLLGILHGTGECVDLVKVACGLGATSTWRAGLKVQGAGLDSIASGTAIATFYNGGYPESSDKKSPRGEFGRHAAIYLGHDANGIKVIDQWITHAASERTIRFNNAKYRSNNGIYFHVIE